MPGNIEYIYNLGSREPVGTQDLDTGEVIMFYQEDYKIPKVKAHNESWRERYNG